MAGERPIYTWSIENPTGFEEEIVFGTDKATTRYAIPVLLSKVGDSPDLKRNLNSPIGSAGGGTIGVSVSEGLPEYSGSIEGKLVCENQLLNFVGRAVGDWVDYYTGEIKHYPNSTVKQCVTYDSDGADVDNTTEANSAGGTAFDAFPAADAATDALMIGVCFPINAIYIDVATAGAGGTFQLQDYNGAWGNVTSEVDGTSELTVDGTISWTPSTDIVRHAPTFSGVTGQYLYWYRLLCDGAYSAGTMPTINQIKVSYPIHTLTMEYGYEGANPNYRLYKGFLPVKRMLKITQGEDVTVTYDYIAKTRTIGTTSAATNGLPDRTTSTTGTNEYFRPTRAFKGSGDHTVAFSNAPTGFNATIANDCVRSAEITEDSGGTGHGAVGSTTSIENIYRPNVSGALIDVTLAVVKKNDDFETWATSNPNASAGQTDLTLTLESNVAIATSLQADPGTSDTAITLTSAQANILHPGDVIKIEESGLTTRYRMVTSISSGTVNLLQALTTNFTTAADVYLNCYEQYVFTDLFCTNPDNFDVSERSGETVETYRCKPHSYTHYIRRS